MAKLYDINPELVEDRGFLDALKARPWQPSWVFMACVREPEIFLTGH